MTDKKCFLPGVFIAAQPQAAHHENTHRHHEFNADGASLDESTQTNIDLPKRNLYAHMHEEADWKEHAHNQRIQHRYYAASKHHLNPCSTALNRYHAQIEAAPAGGESERALRGDQEPARRKALRARNLSKSQRLHAVEEDALRYQGQIAQNEAEKVQLEEAKRAIHALTRADTNTWPIWR